MFLNKFLSSIQLLILILKTSGFCLLRFLWNYWCGMFWAEKLKFPPNLLICCLRALQDQASSRRPCKKFWTRKKVGGESRWQPLIIRWSVLRGTTPPGFPTAPVASALPLSRWEARGELYSEQNRPSLRGDFDLTEMNDPSRSGQLWAESEHANRATYWRGRFLAMQSSH